MRLFTSTAALLMISLASQAAMPPGYITSVVAGAPDPNGKVPAFNAVPGAGTSAFSEATPQAILNHGSVYVVCITMQNNNVSASTAWSYKLIQTISGTRTIVLQGTVAKGAPLSGNGLYAYCTSTKAIPDSPGPATLMGSIIYNTSPKGAILLNVPVTLD